MKPWAPMKPNTSEVSEQSFNLINKLFDIRDKADYAHRIIDNREDLKNKLLDIAESALDILSAID